MSSSFDRMVEELKSLAFGFYFWGLYKMAKYDKNWWQIVEFLKLFEMTEVCNSRTAKFDKIIRIRMYYFLILIVW